MKKTKITNITGKPFGELKTMLQAAKHEFFTLRLDNTQRKLKNTSSLTSKRKEIAQILTNMREKELAKHE